MSSHEYSDKEDPFNLLRFVSAQEDVFAVALSELRRGRKESHWMWFIFPQMDGLATSSTARKYAIRSLDEARAYLGHSVLGPRLLECCRAILSVHGKSASDIMGSPDDTKLKSSMTLFSLVTSTQPEFREIIWVYFGGKHDRRTLELLKIEL